MQHGTETEPQARAQFTMRTGLLVEEVGFVPHPDIDLSGASPDGLVGENGLVEIKCPNTATHIQTLRGKPIDRKYILQMQWQMACTGRDHCWFVSFDPRMPGDLSFYLEEVAKDDALISEISEAVRGFSADLEEMISDLNSIKGEAA